MQLGSVDVKVKAWMPGESLNAIERAQRLSERENMQDAIEGIETLKTGMTAVTVELQLGEDITITESEDIRGFWDGFVDKWGVPGLQEAAETVLKPATDDMEDKADAADGFRQDAGRDGPRTSR